MTVPAHSLSYLPAVVLLLFASGCGEQNASPEREIPTAQGTNGIVDRGRRDHNILLVVREWKNHNLAAAISFVQTTPAIDDKFCKRLLR